METMNTDYQSPANTFHGYTDETDTRIYQQHSLSKESLDEFQKLTENGFVPLSKKEREEAKRIALESGFSFEGYQVVRREFISHRFDPTLTIKNNSITFNNACISRLDEVVYVQLLINPLTQTLVVRPCEEGSRDAVRWCVAKDEKRKSRQITCKPLAAKLYDLMGWESIYRYKLQGFQITYHGEQLYVFDLTSNEMFLPQKRDPNTKRKAPKPMYPADWRNSFGMPVSEHTASTQINLMEGFSYADDSDLDKPNYPLLGQEDPSVRYEDQATMYEDQAIEADTKMINGNMQFDKDNIQIVEAEVIEEK